METAVKLAPARAADAIRKLIVDHTLGVEAVLPPVRDLSKQLGFSYVTIRAAHDLLAREGIVRSERGRGTFVVKPPRLEEFGSPDRRRKLVGYVAVTEEDKKGYDVQQFHRVERILRARGYRAVLGILDVNEFGQVLPPGFDELKLDALIVDGFLTKPHLHRLVGLGKPLLVAGNHAAHDRVPGVWLDFQEVSRLVTSALLDQGMGMVHLICEPLRLDYTRELLAGYREALLAAGRGPEAVSFWEEDSSHTLDSLRQAFRRFGPKLGILGYCEALGQALSRLASEGVEVSQCLAVVGRHDRVSERVRHVVLEFPVEQVAAETAESVCRLLNGEAVGDKVLRPVLQRLEVNGKVGFEWKVCEGKRNDRNDVVSGVHAG